MYNTIFWCCVGALALLLFVGRSETGFKPDPKCWRLQWTYLMVFLLFKVSDWMQGPYFHQMYSTKVTQAEVAYLFLAAFVASTVSSLVVGSALDVYGPKVGSIAFVILFATSGVTSLSDDYYVLLVGRVLGGAGASLLHTAPEAYLVNEISRQRLPSAFINHMFSWMYFADGLVAILAGWVAEGSVSLTGTVTAPFTTSSCIAVVGGAACLMLWGTGIASKGNTEKDTEDKASTTSLVLLALVQSLFESSMYVFVLNWGKAMAACEEGQVPFGTIFAAFMTSMMIGATTTSLLLKKGFSSAQLLTASAVVAIVGLGSAIMNLSSPYALVCSFCVYEASVGMYFPSMGSLRAQLIPEASRGLLMNLNRVPLNLLVITAMLYYEALGVEGCLKLCVTSLIIMCAATFSLGVKKGKSD